MYKKSFTLLAFLISIPCSLSSAQSGTSDYGSGVHQYFSGRYQAAINTLNEAITADSKNSRAYYFRGLAKSGAGDSLGAKSDFEKGALIESSSSKTRTSLVTRSLERVQGAVRLELEKTRKRVFAGGATGSSTMMASSIPSPPIPSLPIESYPIQSRSVVSSYSEIVPQVTGVVACDAPVASLVYSAPIAPALPIHCTPIVCQQPQIIFSAPIQSQTAFGSQVVDGFSKISSDPVYDPAIVATPATGSARETPSEELGMASTTTPGPDPEPSVETATVKKPEEAVVDIDALAAAANEPEIIETFGEELMPSGESSIEAEIAAEPGDNNQGVFGGEAEATTGVEPSQSQGVLGDAADVTVEENVVGVVDDPFNTATSEPVDAKSVLGGEASESVEVPVETEGGSDPFGV